MGYDEEFYRAILDNIADGVYFCDRERRITYWNRGAERITGYSADQIAGSSCSEGILVHVDERGTSLCQESCPLEATIQDGKPRTLQAFLHHKEGHRVPVLVKTSPMYAQDGRIEGVVETFSDNSALLDALRRVDELSVETETDPLTQVANRRSMETRLQSCVLECAQLGQSAGLLYIDVDLFKDINDRFGHEAGDLVLKMVAKTLQRNLRSSDVVARWGGEEFVALLRRVTFKTLTATAEKLRALVANSFVQQNGGELRVTISVGATLLRPDDTAQSAVARADGLLYQSKTAGRNRVTVTA